MDGERTCENCKWRLNGLCNNDTCQNCEEFEGFREFKCRISIDDTIDQYSTPCARYKPMNPCDYHMFEGEKIEEEKDVSSFKTITDRIINFGRNESTYWGCALAGEVGELCNIIKKLARDGADTKDKEGRRYFDLLPAEMADVFIYLVLTARHFNIDLEAAIISKIEVVKKRQRGVV